MMSRDSCQNTEYTFRLIIMDSNTTNSRYYLEYTTIYDTKNNWKYFSPNTRWYTNEIMITEGYITYPSIIKEFNMIQQKNCIIRYHFYYN